MPPMDMKPPSKIICDNLCSKPGNATVGKYHYNFKNQTKKAFVYYCKHKRSLNCMGAWMFLPIPNNKIIQEEQLVTGNWNH